jgi:hypothetical protein
MHFRLLLILCLVYLRPSNPWILPSKIVHQEEFGNWDCNGRWISSQRIEKAIQQRRYRKRFHGGNHRDDPDVLKKFKKYRKQGMYEIRLNIKVRVITTRQGQFLGCIVHQNRRSFRLCKRTRNLAQ